MNCEALLKKGFVACCIIAALTGVIAGTSCEVRRVNDCGRAWDAGGQRALGAAGALATALANFRLPGNLPPSQGP